jgi:hypothetical protein
MRRQDQDPQPLTPVPTDGPPAAAGGRTADGRFAPGNKAAAGNPFHRRVAALRQTLVSCVSEKEMKALGRALFKLAKGGDAAAAKVLLAYLIGKPGGVVDPDEVDWHEYGVNRHRAFVLRPALPDPAQEALERLKQAREARLRAAGQGAEEQGDGGPEVEPGV